MTRIKICGLTRLEDLEFAIALGANAVGLVIEPSSPRCVGLADASRLLEAVPPYVSRVAVLGPFDAGPHLASFDAVQAIGVRRSDLDPSQRAISVYRVGSGEKLSPADESDAVLLDAYVKEGFGGSGVKVDIEAAKALMAEIVRPVIIAGGLTPENVAQVVTSLRPFAVDVSSGVESEPRIKDKGKLRAFFDSVREADGTQVL